MIDLLDRQQVAKQKKKDSNSVEFENKITQFLKQSEDRLLDLKHNLKHKQIGKRKVR